MPRLVWGRKSRGRFVACCNPRVVIGSFCALLALECAEYSIA